MRTWICRLILIAAWGPAAALPLAAQKAPVYDCYVLQADGGDYITLGLAKDNNTFYKQRYPTPAGLDALRALCRSEIAKFTAKDAEPITVGKVDLNVPAPLPAPDPIPPTQAELDLADFQERVTAVRKLASIVPPDDQGLADARKQIANDLKAHPEWTGSI